MVASEDSAATPVDRVVNANTAVIIASLALLRAIEELGQAVMMLKDAATGGHH